MSYRCERCGAVVPPGVTRQLVVDQTRTVMYLFRPKAHRGYVRDRKSGKVIHPLRRSKKNQDRMDDPGGHGTEIAVEMALCAKCAGGQI